MFELHFIFKPLEVLAVFPSVNQFHLRFVGTSTIAGCYHSVLTLPGLVAKWFLCIMDATAILSNGQQGVMLQRTSSELSPIGNNISYMNRDAQNLEQAVLTYF